jgi:HlyD family secretion protein
MTSGIQSVETAQSNLTVQEAPPIPDTLESAKASLDSANASLETAQMNYDNETITAPFAGKIAALNVTVGQQPSNNGSASPDVIATLITDQLLAQVSLNEVDAAKVQLGDVATMTFSAIPNLTLTGKVVELDTIGTVTSGVTTYNAQIAFDLQNSQVKDGMSVTATIVTDAEPNVILVPSGAIKTQGGTSYVMTTAIPASEQAAAISTGITLASAPTATTVTVGNSNNTQTVVTSGLTVGDYVLVRMTGGSSATVSAASAATSRSGLGALTGGGGFGGGGGGGGGGGAFVRTGGTAAPAAAAGR